ncbi:MAG TPA: hypothetical protein VHM88_12335 [Candidatus Acidoferrales bacterium]|jgi:hypothetical protein|nr:hypothetical protein [Candidatus Acidoferrales bacterium]
MEVGGKRAFASAADFPGWCRAGKDEATALAALAAYATRYAAVAKLAHVELPRNATDFDVIERAKGNATTDFGAPSIPAKAESRPLTAKETERMVSLMAGCWKYLDQVRAKAPKALRLGPRGGGRDRDKIYAHVLDAELAYAQKIGLKLKAPDRKAMLARFAEPNRVEKWPIAYAVRRTAWHALDHAWEIEDRIP